MFKNTLYMLKFVWRADKGGVVFFLVSGVWRAFYMLVVTLIYKLLIDGVVNKSPLPYMLGIAVGFFAVTLIALYLMLGISPKAESRIAMRTEKVMLTILLEKAARIDAEKYDDPEFYDTLTKAMTNASTRAVSIFGEVVSVFCNSINIAVNIGLMVMLSPFFIVISAVSVAVGYIANTAFAKKKFEYNEVIVPLGRRADYFKGLLFQRETVTDVKQYTQFGGMLLGKFTSALAEKHAVQTELDAKQMSHNLRLQTVTGVTTTLFPYLYLGYGAYAGNIALGDMTVLINAFGNARSMILALADSIASLKESSMYVEHLKAILSYEPKIESQTAGLELRGDEITEIAFDNVAFKYPNSENYVLRNVSFTIRKGQKLALVGINGAGKTTLVKLLMRFYDTTDGAIKINGRDLREYDIRSLRNAITTVFQEFQAYSLLISELISCDEGETIDGERVRRVLEQVGLLGKISEHPDGINAEYSRYFDENGLVFSGGQVQKMIIARMLYKGSAVIVMDEPSSALDPESEYAINRDIAHAAENKTVIMISHRLSTTKDADKIVLIEDGEVREQGSHAELLAKNGRYAYLFNIQASEYVGEAV